MKAVLKVDNFIDGIWIKTITNNYLPIINPANKEIMGEVALSDERDLEKVVLSSKKAFSTWSKLSMPRRINIINNFLQLVLQNKDELAKIITLENGKPLSESYGEVQRGVESIQHAIGSMNLYMGDSLANVATDVEVTSYNYPIGIIAGISPFNFPMMVPCWMFPLAIALGNTFIMKPSEKTPSLVKRLAELFIQAGLPDGVFNVINGGKDTVDAIINHHDIAAISFVGSKKVGEYIYQKGSEKLKRVQALTGAKNHVLVLNDADIPQAVDQILKSAFGSAGERCMACSVAVVQNSIADSFIKEMKNKAEQLIIGDGLNNQTNLGPVISQESLDRINHYIQLGIDEKADLILDGRKKINSEGFYIGATIFDNVKTNMSIWKDEIFGPVLSIVRANNLEEAIAISNESEFANGACIFTNNAGAIRYFRENIDAGMLGINLGVPAPIAIFPFSGWKSSFYGTSHANGKDGVAFYTRRKVVTALLKYEGDNDE